MPGEKLKAERISLVEARDKKQPWKKWGSYRSERQLGGTVREDYSETGSDWDYFSHNQARSLGVSGEKGACFTKTWQ
jgi:hypothetical protein